MANCELQALAYPESCPCEVCFWHLADIEDDTEHVCSQDGHRLMHAQGRQVSVSWSLRPKSRAQSKARRHVGTTDRKLPSPTVRSGSGHCDPPYPLIDANRPGVSGKHCTPQSQEMQPDALLDRFKKIDRRVVHDPRFRHRLLEVGRSAEILGPLRVLCIEDHDNLALVIG